MTSGHALASPAPPAEPVRDPLNVAVSASLGLGSLIAVAVLAIGLVAWLLSGAPSLADEGLEGWIARAGRRDPSALIFVGLVLVTLTPVVQLLAALGTLVRIREWRNASVAAGLLIIIVASAAVAVAIGGLA